MLVRSVTAERVGQKRKRTTMRNRSLRKARIYRNPYNASKVHCFTRKCRSAFEINTLQGFRQPSGGANDESMQFHFALDGGRILLGGVAGDSPTISTGDFTALFDQYRIDKVKIELSWGQPESSLNQQYPLPTIYKVIDYDDTTSIASIAAAFEYGSCETLKLSNASDGRTGVHTIWLKPRPLVQTYRSAITTGYQSVRAGWMDCAQTDIPHYGMKLYYDNAGITADTTIGRLIIVQTYYFSFRNTV